MALPMAEQEAMVVGCWEEVRREGLPGMQEEKEKIFQFEIMDCCLKR